MIPGIQNSNKQAEPRALKQFSPQVGSNKAKAIGLNEDKVRMQEDRLAQYGLLQRGGNVPNTRHASKHADTNAQGTVDLANL